MNSDRIVDPHGKLARQAKLDLDKAMGFFDEVDYSSHKSQVERTKQAKRQAKLAKKALRRARQAS